MYENLYKAFEKGSAKYIQGQNDYLNISSMRSPRKDVVATIPSEKTLPSMVHRDLGCIQDYMILKPEKELHLELFLDLPFSYESFLDEIVLGDYKV
ncbi:hypothetical protein Tco_1366750 [Tanacetum coccineum]